MLADIGRRNEDLSQRDGVVRKEVEAEDVLSIGVVVNDVGNVDNQANGL